MQIYRHKPFYFNPDNHLTSDKSGNRLDICLWVFIINPTQIHFVQVNTVIKLYSKEKSSFDYERE